MPHHSDDSPLGRRNNCISLFTGGEHEDNTIGQYERWPIVRLGHTSHSAEYEAGRHKTGIQNNFSNGIQVKTTVRLRGQDDLPLSNPGLGLRYAVKSVQSTFQSLGTRWTSQLDLHGHR